MKDRYCEFCEGFVGRMSDKAWDEIEHCCDNEECLAKLDKWEPDRAYQAGYAYACGYYD